MSLTVNVPPLRHPRHIKHDVHSADFEVHGVVLSAGWSKNPTLALVDLKTGVRGNVSLFQAMLCASKMPYIKAFPRKEQRYWVSGLIDAIEYFGGLPALIAPQAHNSPKIPEYFSPLNDSAFGMFSKFYDIPVLPVSLKDPSFSLGIDVFKPADWILRQLRDKVFYSLDELNDHISLLLSQYVTLPSSACADSLLNIFCIRDKPMLRPLPTPRFSIIDIAHRMVGDNCFIKYSGSYYSVPYTFCKQKVIVHVSKSEIIIYDISGVFLASHKRVPNTKYVIDPSHMPPKYKLFGYPVYDGGKYVEWADHIGSNTRCVIECLLASAEYEQRAFRTCMAILQLSKKYGNSRLESACKAAKFYGCISFSAIKRLILRDAHTKSLSTKISRHNEYVQLRLDTGNNL